MSDIQIQQQGQPLRSGYFDRDAFRRRARTILVLKTAVAGLSFHIDAGNYEHQELLESLTPGTELRLYRDPYNEHDKWAILVYTEDGFELGFVTRFKNETIARLMDEGKVFHAYVDEPSETPKDPVELRRTRTPTEDHRLPFSIYMED